MQNPAFEFQIIPVTPFQQNCTLVICNQTQQCAVIDPGGDIHLIEATINKKQTTLEKILLTHGHLDHVGATGKLSQKYNIPVEGPHKDDAFWLESLPSQCQSFGFPHTESFTPSRWLEDGDRVTVGNVHFDVIHCPGHTPGHVIFHHPEQQWAQVGDVLFAGSIGRSDFPGGDHNTLINSIRSKLFALNQDTQFVPGHGPMSTFKAEKANNPFVADRLF